MKIVYTIIIMIIVLFIITFSLNNAAPVQVNYYTFLDFAVPLYLIIFISFGAGIIFAGFVGMGERFRLSRKVSKLKKRIVEQEISYSEAERLPVSFAEPQPEE